MTKPSAIPSPTPPDESPDMSVSGDLRVIDDLYGMPGGRSIESVTGAATPAQRRIDEWFARKWAQGEDVGTVGACWHSDRQHREIAKGAAMTEATMKKQVIRDMIVSMAAEIAKQHEARGDPISRATSHVLAYKTAEGRELFSMPRRPVATLRLRAERLEQGLSQMDLAFLAGMSQSDVSRIETGWVRPYPGQASRLAEVLGVRADELLDVVLPAT